MEDNNRGKHERTELTKTRLKKSHQKNKLERLRRQVAEVENYINELAAVEERLEKEAA